MKRKVILFIVILFGFGPVYGAENVVNPFLQFAGKPYGTYHYALRDTLRKRHLIRTQKCCDLTVSQLRSVPDLLHDGQWEMESKLFSLDFRHKYLKTLDNAPYETGLLALLKESQEKKNTIFELRVTRKLFDFFKEIGRSYDMASYARKLEKFCDRISDKEFPDIIDYKFTLASVYFDYGDYSTAEKYFKEVIASPMMLPIQQIYAHARNDMGLICRNYHHDLDASDKWFNDILAFYDQYHITYIADAWKAVVTGNLGTNQMLRDNFSQAIDLLSTAYNEKFAMKDYNYSFLMAYETADCFCELKQYDKAKEWLDKANFCLVHSRESVESTKEPQGKDKYFMVLNRYYTGTGEIKRAYDYLDSSTLERQKDEREFNTSPFFIVEQKESEEELRETSAKEHAVFIRFLIALGSAILIAATFALFLILYEKKRAAYKRLVENYRALSKQMLSGQIGSMSHSEDYRDDTSADPPLVDKIKSYVTSSQCFLDNEITINSLAHDLGVNRTALSNAINSTGSNFSTYLNQYRVSYAIKELSSGKAKSVEDVAAEAGFNNSRTMRNAFKSITGLYPSYFLNKQSKANC